MVAHQIAPIVKMPFLVLFQQTDGQWLTAGDARCEALTIPSKPDDLSWGPIEVFWTGLGRLR